jgi:hypothetical protein
MPEPDAVPCLTTSVSSVLALHPVVASHVDRTVKPGVRVGVAIDQNS